MSTGGPAALEEVVPALPADFPCPVIVVQHMPASFTGSFAARLDACSALRVVEARDVSPLDAGTAYVVQGGGDAVLERRLGRLALRPVPPDPRHTWHPSVDRVVSSALDVAAPREMLGVLLTGMGDDGAEAMAALRARGGWTIAESEASAVVFGMPRELIERGGASEIDAIGGIATRIQRWARRPEVAPCP